MLDFLGPPKISLTFTRKWRLKLKSQKNSIFGQFFEKNVYSSYERGHRDEFNALVRWSLSRPCQKLWRFEIGSKNANF